MAWASCPKCGYAEPFEDECPKCGVFASKYVAAQGRRASAAPPVTAAPGGAFPPGLAAPVPRPPTDAGSAGAILWWVVGLLVLGGVGYVVLVDWFGPALHFDAPPGWQKVDDDLSERSVQGMCPRLREKTTLHAVYTLPGSTRETAMGILEIDERLPVDEALLAQMRGGFDRAADLLPGVKLVRADRGFHGGRPAVEVQIELEAQGTRISVLQVVLAAERSTLVFVLVAPSNVFLAQLDPARAALATLHPLPSGLRGKPWFKYSLRWLWVLATLGVLLFGVSRWRRAS